MENKKYISIHKLCEYYEVPESFFSELIETGLLQPPVINKKEESIDEDFLSDLEKMMRLHYDLDINMPGVQTVLHLLKRIEELENELNDLRKQLRIYQ